MSKVILLQVLSLPLSTTTLLERKEPLPFTFLIPRERGVVLHNNLTTWYNTTNLSHSKTTHSTQRKEQASWLMAVVLNVPGRYGGLCVHLLLIECGFFVSQNTVEVRTMCRCQTLVGLLLTLNFFSLSRMSLSFIESYLSSLSTVG
jgi:hypothetical protein